MRAKWIVGAVTLASDRVRALVGLPGSRSTGQAADTES